ncbi:hypothetical protein ABH937_005322 [Kitasatospora sp. GAS1066B]
MVTERRLSVALCMFDGDRPDHLGGSRKGVMIMTRTVRAVRAVPREPAVGVLFGLPGPFGHGGGGAQPVAVAVVADPVDYRALRGLGLFAGGEFGRYLRRAECRLRAMTAEGVEVHLRVLEPTDYADFCAVRGLAPGEASARVAYAGDPELAGEPFVYRGEPLAELLPELVEDHLARVRISLARERLRQALGGAAGPVARILERAGVLLRALAAGLGEGCHRLSLVPGEGETAVLAACVERGRWAAGPRLVAAFQTALAAGLAARGGGELLARSERPPARGPTVRGWALDAGRLLPLDAGGVRVALARLPNRAAGPAAGGPIRVRPGFPLPGASWSGNEPWA